MFNNAWCSRRLIRRNLKAATPFLQEPGKKKAGYDGGLTLIGPESEHAARR